VKRAPGPASRILVADDDPSSANALATLLREESYEVVVAMSGKDAMRALEEGSQQLLVVEPSLGDCSGRRLLTLAEELGVPTIVITSDPEFDPSGPQGVQGAGFLYKPIQLPVLLGLMRRALDSEGLGLARR
jgi:DNA-binding NtrC family response regulator